MPDPRDDLFARVDPDAPFAFDAQVTRVFPDMIRRSVPGYEQLIDLTGQIAARFLKPGTRCYDLGCSLGASTGAVLRAAPDCPVELIAVDNSPDMIAGLTGRLAGLPGAERVRPLCADAADLDIAEACVVILNLTLQFVPPQRRLDLLRRVRAGLVPGGALILAEKVRGADADEDRLLVELYEGFKRANGYSDLEIARKRTALERVLVPDTVAAHEQRLDQAGFPHRMRWFQGFSFVAWLAWT